MILLDQASATPVNPQESAITETVSLIALTGIWRYGIMVKRRITWHLAKREQKSAT